MDLRSDTHSHLWLVFAVKLKQIIALAIQRVHTTDFTELLTISRQSEYQGERFRTLLRHSTLQTISSPNSELFIFSFFH